MNRITREEFLKRSATVCGCCGAALLAGVCAAQDKPKPESVFSPLDTRITQGQDVIKRLIAQLDEKLERPVREAIMESCGRLCHDGAHPAAQKATPESATKFLDGMRQYVGKEAIREEADETVVYFKYTRNPRGLKVADGYCLCPIFENAPKGLSPTYCHCSVGYVRAIFEQGLGKPVKVELTASVLRGAKSCDFTVRFKTVG